MRGERERQKEIYRQRESWKGVENDGGRKREDGESGCEKRKKGRRR